MFLFIPLFQYIEVTHVVFKYISCSYLSFLAIFSPPFSEHLNTSHVLIYPLSAQALYFHLCNLNTSHVLIYLARGFRFNDGNLFKYISCSYLSYQFFNQCVMFCIFKYISCSYLSAQKMPQKLKFPDLNTSHVLIYPLWTYPQNFSPSFKYISCSYLSK